MRRPSSLVCFRTALIGLPILVACGTSTQSPDYGNNSGPTNGSNNKPASHSSSSNGYGTANQSTAVYTQTTTSTSTLADGGVTTVISTMTATSVASGNGSGSSNTGSGGSSMGTGSTDGGGGGSEGGSSGARTCAVASTDVVADFEDKKTNNVSDNGFTGKWAASASTGTATATVGAASPVDPSPSCNMYALHGTIAGPISTSMSSAYGNVRADFYTDNQGSTADGGTAYALPYDASAYAGVSFDIMQGSGTTTFPITFEAVQRAALPPDSGGTAMTASVDQYNHRGFEIWSLSSGWQNITVPFALLAPHWFPSAGSSGCGSSGPCEAPALDPKNLLGLQFSVNPDQNMNGSFDLWIDNVTLVKDASAGLVPPGLKQPTWHDTAPAHCALPTGAKGEDLLWGYYNWKNQFVKGTAGSQRYVYSPEINNGSVVSEGIGYGMLLAVYFNDQSLFDDLWSFWKAKSGNSVGLMPWRWDGTGSNNTGSGSATDADEDAAFALIEASKQWSGGSYSSDAKTLIGKIWSSDIDSNKTPLGGSQGYSASSAKNPSYFAPAYYREFAKIDSNDWASVATNVYTLISHFNSSDGLLPAWCDSTCANASSNSGSQNPGTDGDYQYDAHRIPWRVGVDYCWNGTSSATSFLDKNSGFFSGIASTNQIGRIMDEYTPAGGSVSGSAPNSMSIVGTSGVGAMHSSSYSGYSQQAWQFVLDGLNRGKLDAGSGSGSAGYSYYNATIGLMTALMMSGNFYPM